MEGSKLDSSYNLIKFRQVNSEIRSIEYYYSNIDLSSRPELTMELSFSPSYQSGIVEIFFHIRLKIEGENKKIKEFLHCDFVAYFQRTGNTRRMKKILIPENTITAMMEKTLLLSKGYLLANTMIGYLEKSLLSIKLTENYVQGIDSFKDGNLILENLE